MSIVIRGTGSSCPERRLTNADLESLVDTSDAWIVSRTGIRERRMLPPDEATSHMATRAARAALEMAGVGTDEIDLIVVSTVTPDTFTPATANHVHGNLCQGRAIPSQHGKSSIPTRSPWAGAAPSTCGRFRVPAPIWRTTGSDSRPVSMSSLPAASGTSCGSLRTPPPGGARSWCFATSRRGPSSGSMWTARS